MIIWGQLVQYQNLFLDAASKMLQIRATFLWHLRIRKIMNVSLTLKATRSPT